MADQKLFPEGMQPLGESRFTFSCFPGIQCFTNCCKNVDMILYPYDIIRLKNVLGIESSVFLQKYARVVHGDNPHFPTVMLQVNVDSDRACPFLSPGGCAVYNDRPSACRMYPLERAVDRRPDKRGVKEYYFLAKHPYCLGHQEENSYTVREWIRDQRLHEYNVMNELWTEIDTMFSGNPWQGEGPAGSRQQLAFMTCYDIDRFRKMVEEKKMVEQFVIPKESRKNIAVNDVELMKFGFEWLKLFLTGRSSLIKR